MATRRNFVVAGIVGLIGVLAKPFRSDASGVVKVVKKDPDYWHQMAAEPVYVRPAEFERGQLWEDDAGHVFSLVYFSDENAWLLVPCPLTEVWYHWRHNFCTTEILREELTDYTYKGTTTIEMAVWFEYMYSRGLVTGYDKGATAACKQLAKPSV